MKLVIDQTTTIQEVKDFFEAYKTTHDEWLDEWEEEVEAQEAAKTWTSWPYASSLECWKTAFPWESGDIQSVLDLMLAYQRGSGARGTYLDYLRNKLWELISTVTGTNKFGHPHIYFK